MPRPPTPWRRGLALASYSALAGAEKPLPGRALSADRRIRRARYPPGLPTGIDFAAVAFLRVRDAKGRCRRASKPDVAQPVGATLIELFGEPGPARHGAPIFVSASALPAERRRKPLAGARRAFPRACGECAGISGLRFSAAPAGGAAGQRRHEWREEP
jgi:hypothetical protein